MKVEQLFTGCLAEMAYYIMSDGEAAVIDPLRETEPYLRMAETDNAQIKYIFLTHFHADFVSGQYDLAQKTGAKIVFGPNATAEYDIYNGKDGEEFPLGKGKLTLLHTPGHTMESSSYLITDDEGNTPYVCTGDCLFIGDVGRPDLAVKQGTLTEKDLAGHLFDSLRNKIMTLPDDIIVYPNHGAGSACGKNMMKQTVDTLANQKKVNYALNGSFTKSGFIKELTDDLPEPPNYFPSNVKLNQEGYLDFNSSKKVGVSKSLLIIDNFKVKEVPVFAKLLSLASLQGIADLLTGEGIRFTDFEMIYSSQKGLTNIEEMYAIGPAISILMDGYIESKKFSHHCCSPNLNNTVLREARQHCGFLI